MGSLRCTFFGFLFFIFYSNQKENYKKNQLQQVGIYYLTDYPNCDACFLELKENGTYQIIINAQLVEQSNWHFEMGGDYLITYLDNDRYQLGYGKYAYQKFKLRYRKDITE